MLNTTLTPTEELKTLERLANDLYIFTNYEKLAEIAAKNDSTMPEERHFYEFNTLQSLKSLLFGKTQEEILHLLSLWRIEF